MRKKDPSPHAASAKGKSGRKARAVLAPLLVSGLGWTKEEAKETRARLVAFEEDWEAPGMEDYDYL